MNAQRLRRAVIRLATQYGATVAYRRSGDEHSVNIAAPAGYLWPGGTHDIVIATPESAYAAWEGALSHMHEIGCPVEGTDDDTA